MTDLVLQVGWNIAPFDTQPIAPPNSPDFQLEIPLGMVVQGPQGEQGIQGVPGNANPSIGSYVAGEDIEAGTPVYISRSTGKLMIADSSTYLSSFVIGTAYLDIANGFAGDVCIGVMTLNDWSVLTGSPLLQAGINYFLKGKGMLSITPPQLPNDAAVTVVGQALTSTSLAFKPTLPILL